jgi:signal transduction histidine kinase
VKLFPKLALSGSALVLGSIVSATFWVYAREKRDLEDHARQEQQAVLQNLSHIARESIVGNDDLLLVKYIRLLRQWNPNLTSASVVGTNGHILAHSEPSRIGQTADVVADGPSYGLVLSQPVQLGSRDLGVASVTFSQQGLEKTMATQLTLLQRRIAFSASLFLSVGLLLSFFIALSWTRPVGRLARAFAEIGQGHWSIDLKGLDRRTDEIGFLSRSCMAMAGQLAELDQLKDDFVSAVSHELRSPLAAIESYLNRIETLRKRGEPPEQWVNHLQPIRQSAERLERFVDDLLNVAYYETGKLDLERKVTDVAEIATDVLALFDLKLREQGISSALHAPPGLPKAYVDPDRIRQVLTNLVSNAMKFTPVGGRIDIRLERADGNRSLRTTVIDTGIGIAPKDQARVFNKFEQVKSAREKVKGAKGSGLGLAISRALVELHGGSIGVKSEPGQGSAFFFILPVTPAPLPMSNN